MTAQIITTRERELTEGEYVEGVVVKFNDKYYWLLEDGTCELTDVDTADLNTAKSILAEQVFAAIDLADELNLHYAVDKVAEFAEDLYAETN